MTIKSQDIVALIQLFESSDWDEMHLKVQGFELFLSTDASAKTTSIALAAAPDVMAPHQLMAGGERARAASAAAPPATEKPELNWVAVTAPNLGTFYRAAKPGAPPFVEIGQMVESETEICLIEVMKLFTTLKAGVKGIVKKVCVKDAAMVEFGEILFYIEPA